MPKSKNANKKKTAKPKAKAKTIRVRRGFRMRAVLESIADIPEEIFCAFDAFLSAGYGASSSRFQYEFDRAKRDFAASSSPATPSDSPSFTKQDIKNYRTMISTLKREGFVKEEDGRIFRTAMGRRKLENLNKGLVKMPDVNGYTKPSGDMTIIICFDVEEKQRAKRGWLRSVLRNLEFKKIQQSVFVGRGPIPKEFLADIGRLRLSEAVEIFEVGKKGTLSNYKID